MVHKMPEPTAGAKVNERWKMLAAHLSTLSWAGAIRLKSEGLLREFFSHAPTEGRAELFEHTGRAMWKSDKVPADIAANIQELWTRRAAEHESMSVDQRRHEQVAFGWYVVDGKLPREWLLKHLRAVLEAGALVAGGSFILKRLAGWAGQDAHEIALCVRRILENDENGSYAYVWREELRAVLVAIRPGDPVGVSAIVNDLGKRGIHDFRDLS
ncbi:MAG: hypothetical protein HOO96_12345 [Polyangiaceae bacterium]|nr:hypothetical protein [Polyangiaceae bacterium]